LNNQLEELFWNIWKELNYKLPDDVTKSYSFELILMAHRFTVNHKSNQIILSSVRDMMTFNEVDLNPFATKHGWMSLERIINLDNAPIEKILQFVEQCNPFKCRGVLICDSNYQRWKLRSRASISFEFQRDSSAIDLCLKFPFEERDILKIIRRNREQSLFRYFPELIPTFKQILSSYKEMCQNITSIYESINLKFSNWKDFVKEASQIKWASGVLFDLKKGKYNVKFYDVHSFFAVQDEIQFLNVWKLWKTSTMV